MSDICCKCSKTIDSNMVLMAFEKYWHQDCFVCNHCKKRITQSFHQKNNEPFCDQCWRTLFQIKCQNCRHPIDDNTDFYVLSEKNYHKKCFTCTVCHLTLENKKFYMKDNKVVCEKHNK